jgi:hypothetical protein
MFGFGKKSLYDLIEKEPKMYVHLAGLVDDLKKVKWESRAMMDVFANRFSKFGEKELVDFIKRYDGNVNVPAAEIMVSVAKGVQQRRAAGYNLKKS